MVHSITTLASSTQTSSKPTTTSVTSEKIDATVTMANYKLIQDETDSVTVLILPSFYVLKHATLIPLVSKVTIWPDDFQQELVIS